MKPAQASNTAKVIAASTILLASDPRTSPQVAPGAATLCQKLLSGSRVDRWLAKTAAQPLTRALWRWIERLTLPGIVSHYWHRKRWIERRCRNAIAAGFERVVILGAGFDTLGLRLSDELPQIEVIEIDHPATQGAKRRALTRSSALQPANLRFIALDLSAEPLPAILFDDGKATIIIIEGVLMYLSPADVARLFDALRHLSSGNCIRVVFSFITRWPDGRSGFRPHSWLIERWLAWRNEPFTWAVAPHAMQEFLTAHRFSLMEMAETRQFTEQSAMQGSMLEGENLVVCEPVRAGNELR
ncbi:MAG TPA: class I SAM-dependent methyltransferase [Candidatus Eremiobacteraceae bacterium]|nr:class I SAM-dependent methyltransferase [Candidatus Eremiobacteraceae bacterium]